MNLSELLTKTTKYIDGDINDSIQQEILTDGINIAYLKIASEKHILQMKDTVNSGDMLTKKPNRIIKVEIGGRAIPFEVEGSELLYDYEDTAEVLYSYIPEELKNSTDTPEIPEQYHRALCYYAAFHYLTIDDDVKASDWLNLWNDAYDNIRVPVFQTRVIDVYGGLL